MLGNSNSFVSSEQNRGAKDLIISSFGGLAAQHSAPCILACKAKYLSLDNRILASCENVSSATFHPWPYGRLWVLATNIRLLCVSPWVKQLCVHRHLLSKHNNQQHRQLSYLYQTERRGKRASCRRDREGLKTEVASVVKTTVGGMDHLG